MKSVHEPQIENKMVATERRMIDVPLIVGCSIAGILNVEFVKKRGVE